MAEKEKDTITSPAATQAQAAPAQPVPVGEVAKANEADTPPKQTLQPQQPHAHISKGEKWFNRIVYQGLNYWTNLGISLVVTDIFLHGKGNGWFKKAVSTSTNKLTAVGFQRPTAKWLSEIALGTFSLNSGGNILLNPTKLLEDRKRPIVHWINEKLGVDQTAPDGHKLTADEIYIEKEQPKQSWGRMIGRRALGWGATTVVGLTLDRVLQKKADVPYMVDGELKTYIPGQKVFTDMTVKGASTVLNSGFIPGGKTVAANPAVQRYMGYAALDWIYTIITSTIMHKTNGASKKELPKEIGDDNAPPAVVAVNTISKQEVPLAEVEKPATPLSQNMAFSEKVGKRESKIEKKNDESFVGNLASKEQQPATVGV